MREYSPDRFMKERNPETREQLKEIFRVLTRAYETLSDNTARREYDLSIPEFTGAQEREDDMVLEALWSGEVGPGPLPDANPELAKSFYENALDDFQKNDHMSAELNFKLAVALDPENDDYKAGLAKSRRILHTELAGEAAVKGLGHEEEGRFRRAIRWMSRAVELDPEVPDYRYDLARLIEAHGQDLNSARMHILMALDRHPGKVDYLLLFGMIQQRLGETSDARRTFKKVLSLDPENETAKEKLENLEK
jgi:tetratricopeptide (TPR) repeat protein